MSERSILSWNAPKFAQPVALVADLMTRNRPIFVTRLFTDVHRSH
jgi:hypothetical protein